jgi:hypothetical protein
MWSARVCQRLVVPSKLILDPTLRNKLFHIFFHALHTDVGGLLAIYIGMHTNWAKKCLAFLQLRGRGSRHFVIV